MRVKSYILLMLNLAVSSAHSLPEVNTVDVGENSITEDLTLDDIREPSDTQRSSILPGNKLWTFPVPYVLDKGLDLRARGVILRAFDQFRVKSCIDFKPRDSEEYYLNIQKLDGCWSYIGRIFSNGQDLSIGQNCDSVAIVEHEILHALGFYHEQSRYDRDNHVQIEYSNILAGKEHNFRKVASQDSTTHGSPYDYMSVMHYSKNAFTNGNGPTIITINQTFQDLIGQRVEMSPSDVQELNLLYKCNSSVTFKFYCGFSNKDFCQMNHCSQSGNGWELVTKANGGPSSDHTSLPNGKGDQGEELGFFMHASTASGQEGQSARLETKIMRPSRRCNIQCLQFYYYHSGNKADELNIWIREFDEQDSNGTLRLMEQISGFPTSHWKLHHVSLNATKDFQVVFEVRKGEGNSTGGFSVDDINLSETECPHLTLQIDEIEKTLSTSASGTRIYSPRRYSKEGYAYRVAAILYKTYVGMFVQLLSGKYDSQLTWPCLQREMSFTLLDQTPNMQLQMSKQQSFVSLQTHTDSSSGTNVWDNPRETGTALFYENGELVYGGLLYGYGNFATLEELRSREVLKGGSAIFMFNFEDLNPLNTASVLPCPQLRPVDITNPPPNLDEGPCSQTTSTITPPLQTEDTGTTSINTPPLPTESTSAPGFSAAVVPYPFLIFLLAVMLLTP
ncbi:PREDICTED: meprin A subunit beta-like [Poecilia mexicana]|uniref:meprin A subunit beta-like n=1 Tax=Poecilia mexicana TaxID=48701 RepID=UPI00072E316D|nr:PREDICTED: meprin A subunit beta-like [Poecilia mexicana]